MTIEIKDQILEIIIKKIENDIELEKNENKISALRMFTNTLKFIKESEDKPYSLSNFLYVLITENNSAEEAMYTFHKSLRQIDMFGSAYIDMIFWHGLNVNFINRSFFDIFSFIFSIVKKNKYNNLKYSVDQYVNEYINCELDNF